MRASNIQDGSLEPTVVGAVRRYWVMVVVIALVAALAGAGYATAVPHRYRADATLTVPPTADAQAENSDQYLDSQVLLLKSQEVSDRAVRIANAALGRDVLTAADYTPEAKLLTITPPQGVDPGTYGSSLVSVSFTWTDPLVAQAGANALLQAFDDARVAAINAEGEATVAAIEAAIADTRNRDQLSDLVNRRTIALVNQEVDAARHPSFTWAALPTRTVDGGLARTGAVGLAVGLVVGVALAYARALRRRAVGTAAAAVTLYDAPLVGTVSAPRGTRGSATPVALPMASDRDSAGAEAYRLAAAHLERIRTSQEGPLVVAVVAAAPGGTKSFVVANLALAAAERGLSVVAVDADPGAGSLTRLLLPKVGARQGLTGVLEGRSSLAGSLQGSEADARLEVLGTDRTSAGRANGSLPYAKAAAALLAEARAEFDVVLLDVAPLLTAAAADELVAQSGTVLVLVAPDDPVRTHVALLDRLDLIGAAVVGLLFQTPSGRSWAGWPPGASLATRSVRRGGAATVLNWE